MINIYSFADKKTICTIVNALHREFVKERIKYEMVLQMMFIKQLRFMTLFSVEERGCEFQMNIKEERNNNYCNWVLVHMHRFL